MTTILLALPAAAQDTRPGDDRGDGRVGNDATQTDAAPQDPASPTGAATVLGPVNATATRAPRAEVNTPATVTVITGDQLERQNAIRPQDTIRYEPGVSFGTQPTRGGGTNFVIRGIGENRVRVQIDGIRLPDFPGSNAGAGTYTRDFIDLETVRRLEIVRGPASALYGSDALGGVVSYFLKDPADYLAGSGRDVYFSLRGGYSGADTSFSETVTGAARAGNVEAMLLYTRRDGHELGNNGSIPPNPQTYYVNDLLARVVIRGENADVLRLTGEFFERVTTTDIRTDRGIIPGGGGPNTIIFDSQGRDRSWRGLLAADYTREEPLAFVDRMVLRAFWTEVNRREQTTQERASYFGPVPPVEPTRLRRSDFKFIQPIIGGEAQFNSNVDILGYVNRLTYGSTLEYQTVTRPRDRQETNLLTGTTTNVVAGETFPNKNFPDTGILQFGAYVQDELRFGALSILPAARIDYYGMKPYSDSAFRNSAQVAEALNVQPLNAVAVSPKFGAVYRFDENWSVYGQYAHGFRAPPYDNANFGFTNPVFGYQILPSANLTPETSNGIELGVRARWANGSSAELVGFYNKYANFIDTVVVGTSAAGLTQYQYQNIASVTIGGIEARGRWQVTDQIALRGAVAWAQGVNNDTRAPINSVDPVRIVSGIAWEHPSGFGAEAIGNFALRHNRVSEPGLFQTPGYAVLDLAVHYNFGSLMTINAGLFNVTNTKYFVSQDVIGLAANNPRIDLYTQPGRYAAINAVVRW